MTKIMTPKSYPARHGKRVTKRSKRKTDRAPHMGEYVRVGKRFGENGIHIVIGNQSLFMPDIVEKCAPRRIQRAFLNWKRDMLCIAFDNLVKLETKRRRSRP